MISRTLGAEFGGTLGLLLYSGNVLGGTMNVFGFLEPLRSSFSWLPDGFWWQFLYGSATLLACTCVCLLGSKLFARTSLALFGILATCSGFLVLSFLCRSPFEDETRHLYYTGLSATTFGENAFPSFQTDPHRSGSEPENFASIFGILYPSCTGILAGKHRNGWRSMPRKISLLIHIRGLSPSTTTCVTRCLHVW